MNDGRHIERSAGFRLPVPAQTALPMFTPEGERDWVPGWDPEPLHAPGGSLSRAGAVFRTTHDGEATDWLVLDVDFEACTAAYVRITPGHRLGTVHVRCVDEDAGCRVEVDYRLTALSADGTAALAALTVPAFEARIEEWRTSVEALLATS